MGDLFLTIYMYVHVESNSECNRHVYLRFTLARLIILVSMWLHMRCVCVRHDRCSGMVMCDGSV